MGTTNDNVKPPQDNSTGTRPKRHIIDLLLKELSTAVFPLIASIAAAATLAGFGFDLFRPDSRKTSDADKFFQYLSQGLAEGQFSQDYFRTAFNHFDRKLDGKLTKYGTVETIEDFVVYLNEQAAVSTTNKLEPVLQMLSRARETEPFSSLPSEERRLMDHLQALLESSAPADKITQTMNELKQVILARHKEYMRIEAQNYWSLPLSIVGIFFTLVFGVWTTILTIRQNRIKYQEIYLTKGV